MPHGVTSVNLNRSLGTNRAHCIQNLHTEVDCMKMKYTCVISCLAC